MIPATSRSSRSADSRIRRNFFSSVAGSAARAVAQLPLRHHMDDRERRAELMRHGDDEAAIHFLRPPLHRQRLLQLLRAQRDRLLQNGAVMLQILARADCLAHVAHQQPGDEDPRCKRPQHRKQQELHRAALQVVAQAAFVAVGRHRVVRQLAQRPVQRFQARNRRVIPIGEIRGCDPRIHLRRQPHRLIDDHADTDLVVIGALRVVIKQRDPAMQDVHAQLQGLGRVVPGDREQYPLRFAVGLGDGPEHVLAHVEPERPVDLHQLIDRIGEHQHEAGDRQPGQDERARTDHAITISESCQTHR